MNKGLTILGSIVYTIFQLGRHEEALDYFNKAKKLELDNDSMPSLTSLGTLLNYKKGASAPLINYLK